MKSSKDTWIIFLLGFALAIIGGGFLCQQYSRFHHPWRCTKGVVDHFNQSSVLYNKWHHGQIFYSFSVNGKNYIGSELDPSGGRVVLFSNIAEGSPVEVYYDETDPTFSYPISFPLPIARYALSGAIFIIGILLLGLGIFRSVVSCL
jgi:hypothetical protein